MGPCFQLGVLIKETPQFYFYRIGEGHYKQWDEKVGQVKRVKKKTVYSHIHLEPCTRCRDHKDTQYPWGFDGLPPSPRMTQNLAREKIQEILEDEELSHTDKYVWEHVLELVENEDVE